MQLTGPLGPYDATEGLKLAQWFWRGKFLNDLTSFLQFCVYLPFEEDQALYFNKFAFPLPKNNLYQVF
jgi:hypothetical protein